MYTPLIQKLNALKETARDFNSEIEELAKTDPSGIIDLQDQLQEVVGLISQTEEELREIRKTILKQSRSILDQNRSHYRYSELSSKLRKLGFGGRKTRKHRKRR